MTETNNTSAKWTEQEKTASYARARSLVDAQCRARPREWREDVASTAFTRWLAESDRAPIDQWVRWAVADASRVSDREQAAGDRSNTVDGAMPWAATGNTESVDVRRYTKDEEDELKAAVRKRCKQSYQLAWGKRMGRQDRQADHGRTGGRRA